MYNFPEFNSVDIDAYKFMESFNQNGAVLVRKLIDPSLLLEINDRAKTSYFIRERQYLNRSNDDHFSQQFEFGHIPLSDLNEPNGDNILKKVFINSKIPNLYSSIFGKQINILSGYSLVRRQVCNDKMNFEPTPFHQDCSFLPFKSLIINSWVPLTNCGVNSPSIQVIVKPLNAFITPEDYNNPIAKPYQKIELSEDFVKSNFDGEKIWAPEMHVGDVLFFSNFTVHRTFISKEMTENRISLEIRCMQG